MRNAREKEKKGKEKEKKRKRKKKRKIKKEMTYAQSSPEMRPYTLLD